MEASVMNLRSNPVTDEGYTSSIDGNSNSPSSSSSSEMIHIMHKSSKSKEVKVEITQGVTNRANAKGNFSQRKRAAKQRGKGGVFNELNWWNQLDRWGNGKNYPDPPTEETNGLTYQEISRKVRIPPLPTQYNVFREQEVIETPEPILTKDEKYALVRKNLKETVIMKGEKISIPKQLPVRVQIIEITENATVMVRLRDSANEKMYSSLQRRLQIWFSQQRFNEWNTQLDKDDVIMGRIVLAMVAEGEWIRAKIVDCDGDNIKIHGVDEICDQWVPFDHVFYHHKTLNSCPFQIQEFALAGLKSLEGTILFKCCRSLIMKALKLKLKEPTDDFQRLDDNVSENDKIDSKFNFILTKINKIKNREDYAVVLNFPKEFGEEISLNTFIEDMIEIILRPADYMYTV